MAEVLIFSWFLKLQNILFRINLSKSYSPNPNLCQSPVVIATILLQYQYEALWSKTAFYLIVFPSSTIYEEPLRKIMGYVNFIYIEPIFSQSYLMTYTELIYTITYTITNKLSY